MAWLNTDSETVAEIEPPFRLCYPKLRHNGKASLVSASKSRKLANGRLNMGPQGLDVSPSHALKPEEAMAVRLRYAILQRGAFHRRRRYVVTRARFKVGGANPTADRHPS
jgi:hypothetical protein